MNDCPNCAELQRRLSEASRSAHAHYQPQIDQCIKEINELRASHAEAWETVRRSDAYAEQLRGALHGMLSRYDFGDNLPEDHPIIAARAALARSTSLAVSAETPALATPDTLAAGGTNHQEALTVKIDDLETAAWCVVLGWRDNMTVIEEYTPLVNALHTLLLKHRDACEEKR